MPLSSQDAREQRRLLWAIGSQLAADRDLIRCGDGILIGRAQAQAIVRGLELADAIGARYDGHELNERGEWLFHLTVNLGRIAT